MRPTVRPGSTARRRATARHGRVRASTLSRSGRGRAMEHGPVGVGLTWCRDLSIRRFRWRLPDRGGQVFLHLPRVRSPVAPGLGRGILLRSRCEGEHLVAGPARRCRAGAGPRAAAARLHRLPSVDTAVPAQRVQHTLNRVRRGPDRPRDLFDAGLARLGEVIENPFEDHGPTHPSSSPGPALRRAHQRRPATVAAKTHASPTIQAAEE